MLQGALEDAWLLPPTLLAQYHFNPGSKFKPYVGAGVDIHLRNNMYLNIDVKKLWMDTDATVTTTAGTIIRADVDMDPWIFGIGVGWKLGGGG